MAQHKFSPILRPHFDNQSLLYHNKNIITILQAPDNGDGDNPLSYSFFSLQKCMQRCGRQVHPAISTCSVAEWKTCLFSNIWLFCPSSFSDLRSPHTDMKLGLNTQIKPGSTDAEKTRTEFISTSHSHMFIFKEPDLANRDFITLVAGKNREAPSTQSFFWAFRKKSPKIKPTSVEIITRLLYHMFQW